MPKCITLNINCNFLFYPLLEMLLLVAGLCYTVLKCHGSEVTRANHIPCAPPDREHMLVPSLTSLADPLVIF